MKHIICIKLTDNSDEQVQKLKDLLLSMKGKVPMVDELWVGTDFLHSARSFDVVMMAELRDRSLLEPYQNDPYHMSVKAYISTVAEKIIAVDCE